jgi:hypothetical protein
MFYTAFMFLLLETNISKKNVKIRCQYITTLLLLQRSLPVHVNINALCEKILEYSRGFNGTGK